MKKTPAVITGLALLIAVIILAMQPDDSQDSAEDGVKPVEQVKSAVGSDDDLLLALQQRDQAAVNNPSKDRKFSGNIRSEELDLLITGEITSKREAFDDLYREVNGAEGKYKKYGDDLYPYLAYALSDPDVEIAQYASSVLYVLALSSSSGLSTTGFPLITGNEYLKNEVVGALQNSNDSSIRRHAAEILAYAFNEDADIQSLLADNYDPGSSSKVRAGIISGLRFIYLSSKFRPELSHVTLSEDSITVITTAVTDPDTGVSLSALDVVQYVKPVGAVKNLIERLQTAIYPGHAEKIIEVLSLYDKNQVLPYVDELKKTSSAVENDDLRRKITTLVKKLES